MIFITAINGKLRIQAEIPIPNAPHSQWSPARIGKLMETIQQTVAAFEFVDEVLAAEERCMETNERARSTTTIAPHQGADYYEVHDQMRNSVRWGTDLAT